MNGPEIKMDAKVRWKSRHRRPRAMSGIFSILLIVAGVVLFLDNLGLLPVRDLMGYWPVLLIAYGVFCLPSRRVMRLAWGFVWISIGTVLLLRHLGYVHGDIAIPLLLISFGLLSLAAKFERRRFLGLDHDKDQEEGETITTSAEAPIDGSLQETAVFSGVDRTLYFQNFKGGDLIAVFGGIDLDFRQSVIAPGATAIIDTTAIFGGIELKVPETWKVLVNGIAVFGAYEDKTHPPVSPNTEAPKLIITGRAVFGAVEVKN